MTTTKARVRFLATTVIAGFSLAAWGGAEAAAADAPPAPDATSVQEVVVTGSILHHKLGDTISPVTIVTADDLTQRGITTVTQAIQTLSANGSGTLPNSFTANGAFAAGAASVSLRGLSSNSTLTLFDGMRVAYYPLADDGVRNFVDLNTIPDVIVDRVETLKDGASSTYGADAIAGVVNVITKKTFQGATIKLEGGDSWQGGGDERNFQVLLGHGDLARDGYNVYVGIEYEKDGALFNRDRGYPYDTADQSKTCGISNGTGGVVPRGSVECMFNGVKNGLQYDGSFEGVGATTAPVVRPWDPVAGAWAGDYRLLNPAAGCGGLKSVTITPAEAAAGGADGVNNGPVTLCQQDLVNQYQMISPEDRRFSISLRATKTLGANAEGYLAFNYYRNDVFSIGTPASIVDEATPGSNFTDYSTGPTATSPGILLPVYVCASGVNCNATNGRLNPNDPFAAQGLPAGITYLFGNSPNNSEQIVQDYRVAGGVKGDFNLFGNWHYDVNAVYSESDLENISRGDIYIANLLKAVATGSYNFVDPSANTPAEQSFITPDNYQYANSKLAMVQAILTRDLYQLPGGALQLGLTAAARYESVYNPSANDDLNGPTNRWFTINPFGAFGNRTSEDLAFEFDAPVITMLDVNVSGRYDHYSTGANAFSPKLAARFKPFKQVTFRTTLSTGFRIPSFAESGSLPTTGFTLANAPAAFRAAHGNDGYGLDYNLGTTTIGTPGLKPERAKNFTIGVVLDPVPQLSLSVDFYSIEKKDVIAPNGACLTSGLNAYFAGKPIPAGCTVIAGVPDPNLPNALALPLTIVTPFANLNSELAKGYDFGVVGRFHLPYDIHLTTSVDGNYTEQLNLVTPDPNNPSKTITEHYAGTLGPYQETAASGTPRLRFNWQNTFTKGPFTLTVTAYHTSGYKLYSEDTDPVGSNCLNSTINTIYLYDTAVRCSAKGFWDIDAHVSYDITPKVQIYTDVANLFDRRPPYDPTTYGALDYNPAWGEAGIVGRFIKVGVELNF